MNTTQMNTTYKIRLFNKLKNKKYRAAYAAGHTKTIVPFQIRTLREQRGWSQTKLAQLAKTTQAAISRLEDPDYGNISISTLLKLAACFDNALLVKFVPFSKFLSEYADKSAEALTSKTFEEELDTIQAWAENAYIETRLHIATVYAGTWWQYEDKTLPQLYVNVQVAQHILPNIATSIPVMPDYFTSQSVQ
ncbi:MAG: helix-turn-helix transcriptional regulator [Syntrophobacteraceae bacterium]